MTLVRVHAADQHIVFQDQCRCNIGYGPGSDTAGSNSREADDTSRSDLLNRVSKHRSNPRALDNDVRLESKIQNAPGVIRRTEGTYEIRLQSCFDTVQYMDLVSSQTRYGSRQETDRPRAGHQHGPGLPEGTLAYCEDLLQRFYDHRRRLEKHAEDSHGRAAMSMGRNHVHSSGQEVS